MTERHALNFRFSRIEWALLALVLVLRLGYAGVATKVDPFLKKDSLYGDAREYDEAAWGLATRGEMLLDVHRAPLYPLYLSVVYKVVGHNQTVARMKSAGMGAVAVLFFFVCFRSLFGSRPGLWFLGLAVVQPQLLQIVGWIYTENLLLPLLGLFFYFHLRGLERGFGPWLLVGMGVVLGLLTLTRPTILLFTLLYVVWLAWRQSGAEGLRAAALVLVCCALVIAPWTVRNYNAYGGFVPVAMSGHSLAMSNNPNSLGSAVQPDRGEDFPMEFEGRSKLEIDGLWSSYTKRWITSHPTAFLENIPKKYALTVSPLGYSAEGKKSFDVGKIKMAADLLFFLYLSIVFWGRGVREAGLDRAMFWACALLGVFLAIKPIAPLFVPFVFVLLWGYWRSWRDCRAELVPLTLLLMVSGVVMTVFNGASRYLLPFAPFFLGLFCAVAFPERVPAEPAAA